MATLVSIAAHLGAVLAAHVAFQFVDRRGLGSAHNVQGDGLMRIAAEAPDFETEKTRVEGIAERRRWLRRTFVPKHALIPRLTGKAVGFLARLGGALSRSPDRTAVNGFA